MKKEHPNRLTLARETVLQLTNAALREIRGGTGTVLSGIFPCPGIKPTSFEQGC